MTCFKTRILLAVVIVPAAFALRSIRADSRTSTGQSTAISGGAASVDGDAASYQMHQQHKADGYGGFDSFHYKSETKDSSYTIDGSAVFGDDTFRLDGKATQGDKWEFTFGVDKFRTWYDGSGGYFRPADLSINLYSDDMHVDRARYWLGGTWKPSVGVKVSLNWEHSTRTGDKGSTSWADTNFTNGAGTRNIVPTFLDLDETQDVLTLDVSKQDEKTLVSGGVRYERSTLDDKRNIHRQPGASADRFVTSKDQGTTDIFSTHGFVEHEVSPLLTVSAGGLISRLNTNPEASRIYGSGYDPVFDPLYSRRQRYDEGFYGLTGAGANVKQYVFNLNAVYRPTKDWVVQPGLRFEDQRTDNAVDYIETNVTSASLPAAANAMIAESHKDWKEFTGAIEARYYGVSNWTYTFRGEWVGGDGALAELLQPEVGNPTIDRDTNYARHSQKYSFTTNWYAQPGLSFSAQAYFKGRTNDYNSPRDNTTSTADRYPAYIADQDFETNDFNVRMTWRPLDTLGLVSRYDYQRSKIISQEVGLQKVDSAKLTSHIVSQNVTWTPISRLYVMGSINWVWDQVATPAVSFVLNGDNNYMNALIGAGYAVDDRTDVLADFSTYRARDYIDNSATTLPYGADEKANVASLTWTFRQSADLVFSLKYSYAINRDFTSGNINDYTANAFFGRVQYRY